MFKIFCNHEWSVLSETITKSKLEISINNLKEEGASKANLPWQLCDADRKHILVLCCDKCGKLKRFVEEI